MFILWSEGERKRTFLYCLVSYWLYDRRGQRVSVMSLERRTDRRPREELGLVRRAHEDLGEERVLLGREDSSISGGSHAGENLSWEQSVVRGCGPPE